jgi:hypothetical protein
MDKIAKDFKAKGVEYFMLYTREPHPGESMREYDFSDKKQPTDHKGRVDYALEMMKEFSQSRPILVDVFGEKCVQNVVGGGMPNSLIVVDREGKVALWQEWSDVKELRAKLEKMTGTPAGESEAKEETETH